ncbi:MAG: hypothetical protein Fues2KO_11330 [Fuerstiella sp.]
MTSRIRASLLTTVFALCLVAGPMAVSQQPPAETDETAAPLNLPGTHSANSDQLILSWPADNSQLRAFSFKHSLWSTLDIEPTESLKPVVVDDVAVVRIGDEVAAFSAVTGQWKRLKLRPESDPKISAKGQVAFVVDADHIYTFSATNGNWSSPTDPNYTQRLPAATAFRGTGQKFQEYPVPHSFNVASPADPGVVVNSGVRKAEEASLQLARQLRDQEKISNNDRSKLQQAVAQAFDERLAAQEAQLEPLRQKLKRIESTLQTRRENRSNIIEHRMNELLNPDIRWEQLRPEPRLSNSTGLNGAAMSPGGVGFPALAVSPPALPGAPVVDAAIGLSAPPHLPAASVDQNPQPTPSNSSADAIVDRLRNHAAAMSRLARQTDQLKSQLEEEATRSESKHAAAPLLAQLEVQQQELVRLRDQDIERLKSEQTLLELELRAAKLNQERASAEAARIADLSKRNLIGAKDAMEGRVGAELAAIEVQKVQTRIDQLRKLLQRIQDLEPESVDVSADNFGNDITIENVATPEEAKN